jgi:hypothetical protein
MSTYWLVPLTARDPLVLGAERIRLVDSEMLAVFREQLSRLHPRCLLLFKSNLLVGDESEQSCSSEEAELRLEVAGDIVFDGSPYSLSHCAEALLDRLPSLSEAGQWLREADSSSWTPSQREYLEAMKEWNRRGFDVILIKEGHGL